MILPRLTGPHVPRFIASGDFERPYIVMEFIEGLSVEALVEKRPLPLDQVVAIGAKIAFALHDIHCQHVIHLDLKPSNVILRGDDAVLIDFGLSRHDQLPDLMGEEAKGPLGTGAFIAPEQILGDRSDPRSDLFALGVIVYVLATGEWPFGEPQMLSNWRRRLWRDPVPRVRNAAVPPWLQEIILRCLEVEPAVRYATAAQLAFDLQHPDHVALTKRATRLRHDGPLTVARRWLRAKRNPPPQLRCTLISHLVSAPIVLAAIDLEPGHQTLRHALAVAVRRVLKPSRMRGSSVLMSSNLIALRPTSSKMHRGELASRSVGRNEAFACLIPVAPNRITYHVLEATNPAEQIVSYVRHNRVDHIVIGARGSYVAPLPRQRFSTRCRGSTLFGDGRAPARERMA